MKLCKRWNGSKCTDPKGCGNTWCRGSLDTCNILLRAWEKRISKLTEERRIKDLRSNHNCVIKMLAINMAALSEEWFSEYSGIMKFDLKDFAKECLMGEKNVSAR